MLLKLSSFTVLFLNFVVVSVETTYPNIDEHFRRSLGSDYSRVVNRVDVPASAAAAFPAPNVCQGGPLRSPTGTTAAVPLPSELPAYIANKSITGVHSDF